MESRLKVDMSSDASTLQQEISKASIRDTTLRPYGVTGETLDMKGRLTVPVDLIGWKFVHMCLVCPLCMEAAGLLGTDILEESVLT